MTSRKLTSLTEQELENLISKAVRREFSNAGLRIDEDEHQDAAREDFRFLRKFRQAFDGASGKVGGFVLISILGGIAWLIGLGVSAFLGKS